MGLIGRSYFTKMSANNTLRYVQCQVEEEKDDKLPFLDVLVMKE